jgi:hypothetical protein
VLARALKPQWRRSSCDVATNTTTIHVRSGGAGPAVVLLDGYGETGDIASSWGVCDA